MACKIAIIADICLPPPDNIQGVADRAKLLHQINVIILRLNFIFSRRLTSREIGGHQADVKRPEVADLRAFILSCEGG